MKERLPRERLIKQKRKYFPSSLKYYFFYKELIQEEEIRATKKNSHRERFVFRLVKTLSKLITSKNSHPIYQAKKPMLRRDDENLKTLFLLMEVTALHII